MLPLCIVHKWPLLSLIRICFNFQFLFCPFNYALIIIGINSIRVFALWGSS